MKNIATFVPAEPDGCAFFRGLGVLGELRHYDINTKRMYGKVSWMDIADCDIGFMQRPYTPQHLELAKLIKQQMPLWVDYDDLLTAIPESNPAYATYATAEVQDAIQNILCLADVITVSTQALKNELSKTDGLDIRVIRNAYNDYRLPTESNILDRKQSVVLWRGTNSHVGDLFSVKDALDELIRSHPGVRFVFLGLVPWMLDLKPTNIDLVAEQNMYDYHRLLGNINPDVVIVPLEDNTFNQCKSNIAWLETARSGAHVIARPWDEWMVPNVQHYNTEFFAAVDAALLDDKTLRGWNYVKRNLMLSNINKQRAEIVDEFS